MEMPHYNGTVSLQLLKSEKIRRLLMGHPTSVRKWTEVVKTQKPAALSQRERKVAAHVAKGLSNRATAEVLGTIAALYFGE